MLQEEEPAATWRGHKRLFVEVFYNEISSICLARVCVGELVTRSALMTCVFCFVFFNWVMVHKNHFCVTCIEDQNVDGDMTNEPAVSKNAKGGTKHVAFRGLHQMWLFDYSRNPKYSSPMLSWIKYLFYRLVNMLLLFFSPSRDQ